MACHLHDESVRNAIRVDSAFTAACRNSTGTRMYQRDASISTTSPANAAIVIAFHGLSCTKSSVVSAANRYLLMTVSCTSGNLFFAIARSSPDGEALPFASQD